LQYGTESEIDLPIVQTDAEGNATLLAPADAASVLAYAFKPGQGFDYRYLKSRARDPKETRDFPVDGRVALQLGPTRKATILVREPNKKPIAGLDLELWLLKKPGEPDDFNLSYTQGLYRAVTDAAGVAHFDDIPAWDGELIFWPQSADVMHQRIVWDPAK